jgi:hypothetical protein
VLLSIRIAKPSWRAASQPKLMCEFIAAQQSKEYFDEEPTLQLASRQGNPTSVAGLNRHRTTLNS